MDYGTILQHLKKNTVCRYFYLARLDQILKEQCSHCQYICPYLGCRVKLHKDHTMGNGEGIVPCKVILIN